MLCLEGIEHPKQLHGKIMEANRTSRNGFFGACHRKLWQETANAMNIGCSVSLYHVSFVPPVTQGMEIWEGGIAVSERGTRVTEL